MNLVEKVRSVATMLEQVAGEYPPAAFANSFGAEDVVVTDLIARHAPSIEIFTLDTGRLPEATHVLMRELADRYELPIRVYYPDGARLEAYTSAHGANAFFDSVDLRKACCEVRKVHGLRRALSGKRAWVTGLRREQSPTRTAIAGSEFDQEHGLQKFNPLFDWTRNEVWAYIREHDLPYNALHDQGYASIGCAPCTRAITVGEDERAGRWWWEDPESKECGLHVRRPAAQRVSLLAAAPSSASKIDEVTS
ncbi:MAG TPA: phosphoadenylyl-sulfate reductase [Burkholderiales bacterium]|nr:phosphoadenylyl-sulfate reductase [Betaproteobacteria bacterium]HQR52042.1 phosphoadenylyl-sulfate reductase [Burkholderiales bacterium]